MNPYSTEPVVRTGVLFPNQVMHVRDRAGEAMRAAAAQRASEPPEVEERPVRATAADWRHRPPQTVAEAAECLEKWPDAPTYFAAECVKAFMSAADTAQTLHRVAAPRSPVTAAAVAWRIRDCVAVAESPAEKLLLLLQGNRVLVDLMRTTFGEAGRRAEAETKHSLGLVAWALREIEGGLDDVPSNAELATPEFFLGGAA